MQGVPVDLVVSLVAIRSFSGDFANEAHAYSRDWLRALTLSKTGACVPAKTARQFGPFYLARSREQAQNLLFGNTLRGLASGLLTHLTKLLPVRSSPPDPLAIDPVQFLAHKRFLSINFAPGNAEVVALKSLRQLTEQLARKTVFFYGREEPRSLPSLIDSKSYARHRQSLAELIAPNCKVAYVDNLVIPRANYIDYVHVDPAGYDLIAGAITAAANGLGNCG